MEGISISGGVTVVGSDAPPRQHLATSAPPYEVVGDLSVMKNKKRGRPRKYALDGTLSPTPISVIDFSVGKRGKVRPVGLVGSKQPVHTLGEWGTGSFGGNFTPHILTVNAGEDVMMKVISFSQQRPQAICVLSANGVISSVTLRQPDSSGGTLTHEGRFEILSLTGSFMPSETGGIRNRSGGMSISLASPDGRVMGGGVAGSLLAATPIQIVVGSFLAGNQHEQLNKKPKIHTIIAPTPTNATHTISEIEDTYSGDAPHIITAPKSNMSFSTPLRGERWSAFPSIDSRNKPTDINVTPSG